MLRRIFLLLLLSMISIAYSYDEEACEVSDEVHDCRYLAAAYIWFSGVHGSVKIGDFSEHIHLNFEDVLRHMDLGFQGHFEYGNGPWTWMLDPSFIALSRTIHRKNTLFNPQTSTLKDSRFCIHISTKVLLVDAGVFYRLYSMPCDLGVLSIDYLTGLRFFYVRNSLNFDRRLFNDGSGKLSLLAPIIGGRIIYDLTPQMQFWLRGDYGGFDIDNVRDTWSLSTGLLYEFYPHIDFAIGYKALGLDFTRRRLHSNIVYYGPLIGIAARW